MLGDDVERALRIAGVKERMEELLGPGCGCDGRRDTLNAIHSWAKRVLAGRISNAKEYLWRALSRT